MLKNQLVEYRDGDTLLEGYYVFNDAAKEKRPAVLIAHDWSGRNPLSEKHARDLAELGYVGFAIDMFGKGKRGTTKEEKSALIKPLIDDRAKLQKRILAALDVVRKLGTVDSSKIGAIGFCFGGLCVLDLARTGADLKGVVSFHGLLMPPANIAVVDERIKADILVLHGYNDPMVTPEQVMQFGSEMTHAKANWQLNMYGDAMHGFTNPEANDPGFGILYNKQADERSHRAMVDFFHEVFN